MVFVRGQDGGYQYGHSYNSWQNDKYTQDVSATVVVSTCGAWLGWMVMKDLSWYITKFVYEFITGLAKRLSELLIKKTDQPTAAEGQLDLHRVSVMPTMPNGRESELRAIENDAQTQDNGSEERNAQISRHNTGSSPERTSKDWDAYMLYDGAATSGRLLTLRFSTTYTDAENARFETTFALKTHGHDDEEAFMNSVRAHIDRAAAGSSEERDRWLGPDRNVAGWLVKVLVPVAPGGAAHETE